MALCYSSRNGLGKQVILVGMIQEPCLKNGRFSVTCCIDHQEREGDWQTR